MAYCFQFSWKICTSTYEYIDKRQHIAISQAFVAFRIPLPHTETNSIETRYFCCYCHVMILFYGFVFFHIFVSCFFFGFICFHIKYYSLIFIHFLMHFIHVFCVFVAFSLCIDAKKIENWFRYSLHIFQIKIAISQHTKKMDNIHERRQQQNSKTKIDDAIPNGLCVARRR